LTGILNNIMEKIRNFCIISHVDHGKSTLADRFLELTNTVPLSKMKPQYLDMMPLEREKGITIKMQPVRMAYNLNSESYVLNLIDTPGHVDFSYEVSRALVAVEGAILLVDATKGIEAQTIANLELAKKQDLVIIPAVNKIDSPQARIEETKKEISEMLNIPREDIFEISAKQGTNVEKLLAAVIEKIPLPEGDAEKQLRALIFDSVYDSYKGVVAYVRIIDGKIKTGDKISLMQAQKSGEVKEAGFFSPQLVSQREITAGQIGYIATGIKEAGMVRVGDTITIQNARPEPLPGYREPKPMVFASFYPQDPDQFELLKDGLTKLKLNDPSLTFEPETKESLGRGFRCGFLGNLHAEITSERLRREYGLNLVISSPQVLYKITNQKDREISVYSPSDWPSPQEIKEKKEPWARVEVICSQMHLGRILEFLQEKKGRKTNQEYFGGNRVILTYEVPLREILTGFYDRLKGISQGFASMNYEILDWRPADLEKLEILVAGEKEEAFSKIVSRDEAEKEGRAIVRKLKELLPPQLFSVPLQAALGGKIIARETLRSWGKDVIAPLYGGDYTRKKKLLEKQKKGKRELKEKGRVRIPPSVFLEIFKSE
jgi:GTP-binding protein LepA